jgi:hypothetical protein
MITQERLHDLFEYREDGNLIWKVSLSNRVKIGDVAGTLNACEFSRSKGYCSVTIDGKNYGVHRLVFLYHHGYLTNGMQIDHIDCNRENNRIENLREVTKSQNGQNAKIRSTNTSGIKGVSWNKSRKKWHAQIMLNSKAISLGHHNTLEEAAKVVKEAREKYHGEYGRHE